MLTNRIVAVAVWALSAVASIPAAAAVDLNGQWHVEAVTAGDPFPSFAITCDPLAVVQSGTTLSITGNCIIVGAIALSGTIDSGTGAFTLSQAPAGLCGSLSITGTASADSYTFSGSLTCLLGTPPLPIPGTVSGTRCGNGVLDSSEQCDHTGSGDCCNPTTCQFESAGLGCLSDGEVCTDDLCDGGGVCQHLANTEPCNDGNQCTTDVCGGGTCNGTPRPVGTTCDDGDACTTSDQCDASGTCTGGPPLACDPPCGTGVCDPDLGCVADLGTCDDPTGQGGKLMLAASTPDTKDKLAWTWSKGPAIAPGDFGSPLVDTTYTVCVSDFVLDFPGYPIVPRFLDAMTAPAGSRWRATSRGFTYADKTGTPSGLTAITLTSGAAGRAKIKLKGKGPNLFRDLPPMRASVLPGVPLVQLKASNGRCWDTPELSFTSLRQGKLKAKGSPNGAFLE